MPNRPASRSEKAISRVSAKGAVSVNRLTIRRGRAKLDEMDGALRRFNLFPDLYLPHAECGDYLHPGFLMRIDANSVHAVFEVGCSDGTDTLRLARAFPAVKRA